MTLLLLAVSLSASAKKSDEKSEKKWFGEPHDAMFELSLGFFYHSYLFHTIDGDDQFPSGDPGISAADIDYVRDLDYKDKYIHFDTYFAWRFKSFKLSIGYTMFNAETTTVATRAFHFNDANFAVGDDVHSSFNVHFIPIEFAWYALNMNVGKNLNFKFGPLFKLDTFITAGIRMDDPNGTKGDKFQIPLIPVPALIGLSFEMTVYKYSGLFVDFNGLYFGKYLGYINLKTGIRVYPWHWTGIEIAYRHIYAQSEWKGGDLVKMDFHGLNVGFLLRF
jgi:hypothetical protein